jgi:hypothetical protein
METLSGVDHGQKPPIIRTGLPGAGDGWRADDRAHFEHEAAGIEEAVVASSRVEGIRGYAFNARAGGKVLGILGAAGVKPNAAAGGMPDHLRVPPVAKHLGTFAIWQPPMERNQRPRDYS